MSQKEEELVQQLVEKTEAKVIPWEPTAKRNQFVAPFRGNVTFTVLRYENEYGNAFHRLTMRDSEDRELFSLDTGEIVNVAARENLEKLYKAAHDTALRVEETIEIVLDDLRKVS